MPSMESVLYFHVFIYGWPQSTLHASTLVAIMHTTTIAPITRSHNMRTPTSKTGMYYVSDGHV